jgi:hypothetical protein
MLLRKTVSGLMLTLLIISMLELGITTQLARSGKNEWWDSSWSYRRQISITEKSGYSLIDFPISVTLEHNGHVKPDGTDIRVIDDGFEVPYHVENINDTHVTFIFEINITASSTKSIYVYYGNPSAPKPNYPLVPLTIAEGNTGYAIIDNLVYIGWDYTSWGWSNPVELWDDFRIDFNKNNNPTDDNDLIRDYGTRHGGIGRHRRDVEAIGLGEYQSYVRTAVYVDIIFADAKLRVYKKHPWVETTQADFLFMFSPSYTHANYGGGTEQNIIDGLNTTDPELWNTLYKSKINPGWMAFRDSSSGDVFASTGLRIGSEYGYIQSAKETSDWDRVIQYFGKSDRAYPLDPYDQPPECRIYWYGDNSNNYSVIEMIAQMLNNQPSVTVGNEEKISTVITATIDINPRILNLRSRGKWITAYIELPEGYSVADINRTTILLNGTIPVDPFWISKPIKSLIGDYDNDSIPDLMVKFDGQQVINYIMANVDLSRLYEERFMTIALTITGRLKNGTPFQGSDTVKIILPMPRCWRLLAKLGVYPF